MLPVDPLTIGLQAGGLAMQLLGGIGAASNAREAANLNKGIAGDEQQINEQKRLQMEMSARRYQVEAMRNAQRAGAQGAAAAANQGASFGSGLQGGQAQIKDQGNFDLMGINNNLAIGENIFNTNNDISGKKMQLADVQSSQATNTALMSLGGSVVSNAGTIGNISKYVGSKMPSTGFMGPYV